MTKNKSMNEKDRPLSELSEEEYQVTLREISEGSSHLSRTANDNSKSFFKK